MVVGVRNVAEILGRLAAADAERRELIANSARAPMLVQ